MVFSLQNEIEVDDDYLCFAKGNMKVKFATIHVPYPTLVHYADVLGIRMQLADNIGTSDNEEMSAVFRKDRISL